MRLRLVGWCLLPLVIGLLAHALLVRPAQHQLQQAQQGLLAAERKELTAELALAREEKLRGRMERELKDLEATAERMRVAEKVARAQLSAGEHHRPSWVLPGQPSRAAGASASAMPRA